MVALAGRATDFKGARLFDPGRDLASVARLLEEPFRPDSSFRFPIVPLVRVARSCPEARRGERMVGTLGQSERKPAQVTLVTVNGDIRIDLQLATATYSARPTTQNGGANSMEENRDTPVGTKAVKAEEPAPEFDSELAILQVSSAGQITVEEAKQSPRQFKSDSITHQNRERTQQKTGRMSLCSFSD